MNKLDFMALKDAADRSDGWALFRRKTTERLAETQGWFVKCEHPSYGQQFKITAAGRAAYEAAKRGEI